MQEKIFLQKAEFTNCEQLGESKIVLTDFFKKSTSHRNSKAESREREKSMEKEMDYKRTIKELIDKIEDRKALKRLYKFIQYLYVRQ